MKVQGVIKRLEKEGWALVAVKGDRRQFAHPEKLGKVTVSGRLGGDMPKGTLGNIRRQAGW
ncbi:MAG: type II toxin-antitoxin system HicA family toxin [Ktedonobacteraceae bacterium]|nr:type II toxin-antitoxin system HicA family toxin [Ktedonobacteraceae bacterium]